MRMELKFSTPLEADIPYVMEQHDTVVGPEQHSLIIDPAGAMHYIPAHEIPITVAYGRIAAKRRNV